MGTSGLGVLLVEEGLLTETDRRTIRRSCGSHGPAFARSVIAMGLLDEDELAAFLAERTPWRVAPKGLFKHSQQSVWGVVDRPLIERLEVLPLKLVGQTLHVAMVDPLDGDTLKQLQFFTGFKIHPVISTLSQIREGLAKLLKGYKPATSQLEDFLTNHAVSAGRHIKIQEGGSGAAEASPKRAAVAFKDAERASEPTLENPYDVTASAEAVESAESGLDLGYPDAGSDTEDLLAGDESLEPALSDAEAAAESLDLGSADSATDDAALAGLSDEAVEATGAEPPAVVADDPAGLSGLEDEFGDTPESQAAAEKTANLALGDELESLELESLDPDSVMASGSGTTSPAQKSELETLGDAAGGSLKDLESDLLASDSESRSSVDTLGGDDFSALTDKSSDDDSSDVPLNLAALDDTFEDSTLAAALSTKTESLLNSSEDDVSDDLFGDSLPEPSLAYDKSPSGQSDAEQDPTFDPALEVTAELSASSPFDDMTPDVEPPVPERMDFEGDENLLGADTLAIMPEETSDGIAEGQGAKETASPSKKEKNAGSFAPPSDGPADAPFTHSLSTSLSSADLASVDQVLNADVLTDASDLHLLSDITPKAPSDRSLPEIGLTTPESTHNLTIAADDFATIDDDPLANVGDQILSNRTRQKSKMQAKTGPMGAEVDTAAFEFDETLPDRIVAEGIAAESMSALANLSPDEEKRMLDAASLNRALMASNLAKTAAEAVQKASPSLIYAGLARGIFCKISDTRIEPMAAWSEGDAKVESGTPAELGDHLSMLARLEGGWSVLSETMPTADLNAFSAWNGEGHQLLAAVISTSAKQKVALVVSWRGTAASDELLRDLGLDFVRSVGNKFN